jgi:hypothetical protein
MEQAPAPDQQPEEPKKPGHLKDARADLFSLKFNSVTKQNFEAEPTIGKNAWEIYDAPFNQFNESFRRSLPEGGFQAFVDTHYGERKGQLIGMELGGPGSNFFGGFEEGTFKETVGVTLNDLRQTNQKETDNSRHHSIIEADVFSIKPHLAGHEYFPARQWRTVEEWVQTHGQPDMIIERILSPMNHIKHKEIFLAILNRWYKLLAPEGTIFFGGPRNHHETIPVLEYAPELETLRHVLTLEFSSNINFDPHFPFAKLRKLPGAPESLDGLLK